MPIIFGLMTCENPIASVLKVSECFEMQGLEFQVIK